MSKKREDVVCPICEKSFPANTIEVHASNCSFLSSPIPTRSSVKRQRSDETVAESVKPPTKKQSSEKKEDAPLAELMRPKSLDELIGQPDILGEDAVLKRLITTKQIPSMILWGPPGSGKTSLANIISNICKDENGLRFVKLSAVTSGVNDVKEVVKIATNETKFKRKTILFMDEVHRFNKLQQDAFLPHVENGIITLIGATTENPSFSLNSALLSRCRVIVFQKLKSDDILNILFRAIKEKYKATIVDDVSTVINNDRISIEKKSLEWLADICDGDARIALNSLQIAFQIKQPTTNTSICISLNDIQEGIKRSHMLYDRKGEEHYNIISAMHKSIRASDDDAALYWLTRMLKSGEDPLYIARRLVRIAGEDIGLADPNAIPLAVSCMQGCQLIGMPECDVLLAECAIYMARAKKSTEAYMALNKCKKMIAEHKGPLPSVPLHLRNAPTKLMSQLGYGKDYNTLHKDISNLTYMPEGMESVGFFK